MRAFRLATAGVADDTQVHTHMCYADFGDILPAIVDLDADVITLEASRSDMEIAARARRRRLSDEARAGCLRHPFAAGAVGVAEITALHGARSRRSRATRLWVNPDCGLKTRRYPETVASLANIVEATRLVRERSKVTA